jgi:hypothetical protein
VLLLLAATMPGLASAQAHCSISSLGSANIDVQLIQWKDEAIKCKMGSLAFSPLMCRRAFAVWCCLLSLA